MSFETALANSLASMNSISRPFVSTALTDFRTSMQAELVSYGLKTGEKNWLDDQLFELGRELAVELKNRNRSTTTFSEYLTCRCQSRSTPSSTGASSK